MYADDQDLCKMFEKTLKVVFQFPCLNFPSYPPHLHLLVERVADDDVHDVHGDDDDGVSDDDRNEYEDSGAPFVLPDFSPCPEASADDGYIDNHGDDGEVDNHGDDNDGFYL